MKKRNQSIAICGILMAGLQTQSAIAQCMYQPGSAAQMQCEAQAAAQQLQAQQQQYGQQAQQSGLRNNYGALVYDGKTNTYDLSFMGASYEDAKRNALNGCRLRTKSADCQVMISWVNWCVAISDGHSAGRVMHNYSVKGSLRAARKDSLATCKANGNSDCKLVESTCGLPY